MTGSDKNKDIARWVLIIGVFAWFFYDGGFGRAVALAGVGMLILVGGVLWLAKKFSGEAN